MPTTPNFRRLVMAALARPRLWPQLARAAWSFRRRGWYRRPPFLPLPPAAYVDWRFHTAYGGAGEPRAEELIRYLRWAGRMRRSMGGR